MPYVNLTNIGIDPKILQLLPREVAENYMAVPLGEMQNRLVVAMLDADNVQAVDFLSNKIGRPLKVYAASESGIRHVLGQYKHVLIQWVERCLLDITSRRCILNQSGSEDLTPVGTPNRPHPDPSSRIRQSARP